MNFHDPAVSDNLQLLMVNLEQEESRLLAVASLLADLATTGTDDPKLRSRMAAAEKLGHALSADRQTLLLELSRGTDMRSDQVTLTKLIALSPIAVGNQMRASQKRLRLLSRRIQRLVATTVVIVNESLRIHHMVLGGLMGVSSSDRYTAQGTQPVSNSYSTRMESRS